MVFIDGGVHRRSYNLMIVGFLFLLTTSTEIVVAYKARSERMNTKVQIVFIDKLTLGNNGRR